MTAKPYFDYIAVILIYRNHLDLEECICSFKKKVKSCQIIVVNAFYDDDSKNKIEVIANKYECDFLNIENKGYSYGNNTGIEYVVNKYDFRYVIVSNPDIVVKRWSNDMPEGDVIAPKIVTADGKFQNPMSISENRLGMFLTYKGFKTNKAIFTYAGIILGKLSNMLHSIGKKHVHEFSIFIAHGSFLLISKKTILKLNKVYDDNMFLFGEEGVLAVKMKKLGLITKFTDRIRVYHKEDGSMKLSDLSLNEELRKANIYFYEKYYR